MLLGSIQLNWDCEGATVRGSVVSLTQARRRREQAEAGWQLAMTTRGEDVISTLTEYTEIVSRDVV
jgi:hypothetical protein